MEPVLDDLVQAARRGQGTAFGELWRLLAPRVTGYLRGRGVRAADDVTSEVFLAAFRGIGTFSGDGSAFRAWLFTIAHHKAVDSLRRRREDSFAPEDDPRVQGSAEETVLAEVVDPALRRSLDSLTSAQREVLLLRTVADLPVEDVARLTGNTVAGVRQLQKRAVAALRKRLSGPNGGIPQQRVSGESASTIAELP